MFFGKDQIKGLIGTTIFHGLLLVVLLLCGFTIPYPIPEEIGMEMGFGDGTMGGGSTPNFGDSEDGMGNIHPDQLSAAPSQQHTPPQASPQQQTYTQTSDPESIPLNDTKPAKPTTQKPTVDEPTPKPTTNPAAIYGGTGKTQGGGSEGVTGKPGNQGKPGGSLDGATYTGSGTGNGQGNGHGDGIGDGSGFGNGTGGGIGYKLGSRKHITLPKPAYNSNEQGRVIVKIWVDQTGKVVKAQAGEPGTTAGASLWKVAEQAALQSKFSADSDAPDVQTGTITYIFVKN